MRPAWVMGMGLVGMTAIVGLASAQAPMAPMEDDAAFAAELWTAIAEQRLVGPDSIGAVPYPKQGEAHGTLLVSLLSTATVGDATGTVIVKRSYSGEGATRDTIIADPTANLSNVTVMFKREGYDPANQDWFWAMYAPDGAVGQMQGMAVAGHVEFCSACHVTAPGGDFVFLHD